MAINLSRIESVIDCERLRKATVVVVGVGGAATLVKSLVRSGVESFRFIDFDLVGPENMTRQEYRLVDVGLPKVDALRRGVREINPDVKVVGLELDITKMPFGKALSVVSGADLLVFATDSFRAQALGNQLALASKTPAIWPGLYRHGLGGEVVWWKPGLPCYRCLLSHRFKAQEQAAKNGTRLDPTSRGVTMLDLMFVDSIVGSIAVGLLTEGSPTRYGSLVPKLGMRNFLLAKIDPDYALGGRDLVRDWLGVPPESRGFFSWCVAAKADPTLGLPPCEDCTRFENTTRPV